MEERRRDVMEVDAGVEDDAPSRAVNGQSHEAETGQGEGQAGLASLFPNPPSQSRLYTRDNIHRYQVLKAARDADDTFDWEAATPQERISRQNEILTAAAASEQEERNDVEMRDSNDGVEKKGERLGEDEGGARATAPSTQLLPCPDWDVLSVMDTPRVDWIEDDGFYTYFGENWPVEERLPTLPDLGMRQFYPDGGQHDRREVMVTLLRTILKSYLGLVDVLLEPPQEYLGTEQGVPSWRFVSQDKAKDINDLSINFMHLLNEMRPLQAKEDLRDLLKKQLDRRREETGLIRLQCEAMKAELAKIKEASQFSNNV